jgi:hypothetical protein
MDALNWLIKWYKSQCDGWWEHTFGVEISTLDNPGWRVKIEFSETELENKSFDKIFIDNGDNDWISCWVENNSFEGACDADKLIKVIEIFMNWAKQYQEDK